MGNLVTALALTVLVVGAALYAFGEHIVPAAGGAGESTAEQIRSAF